jgi:tetratricopeptide (TPR) repeat protein
LDRFSQRGPEAAIPEDALLTAGQYREFQRYRRSLNEAKALLAAGRCRETLALLLELHPMNPNDYQLYLLAGRALLAMKRWDEAYYNFSEAKKRHPAYLEERREIDGQLEKLEKRR